LKPQLGLSEGSLSIEVYGGYREVGGNCIVVKDRGRKLVFDNGIRFNIMKKYYRGRVKPLGIVELRRIGAIPPLSVFEDADALYITHFHLDHLGLLGALPPGTRVYVPSTSILEAVEEWYRASPTWLAEVPHRLHVEIVEMEPYKEDELGVTPIPVSHSAYPSLALVYRGYDSTLFYSGDLRVSGPLGPRVDTLQNLRRVLGPGGVDVALLEGTNVGSVLTPLGPDEFKSMMNRILLEDNLVTISIDPLDFELLTMIHELALLAGRKVVVYSSRLADTLPHWLNSSIVGVAELEPAIAAELEKPVPLPAEYISVREDVMRNPGDFVLVQDPLGFLDMLRRMKVWGEELPDAVAILTTPEPLEAEAEVEEKVLVYWLHMFGVRAYRIKLSGHYYPHELRQLVGVLMPKRLVPIHTRRPDLVERLARDSTLNTNV